MVDPGGSEPPPPPHQTWYLFETKILITIGLYITVQLTDFFNETRVVFCHQTKFQGYSKMWLSLGTLRSLCISRANGNWLSQIEKHVVVSRLLSDYWEGVWGFKSPFWTKIWTSPHLNEKFLDLPLQRCYSEFRANQGLCWRVQVNQFFSSYIRGSLVGRKTFASLCQRSWFHLPPNFFFR